MDHDELRTLIFNSLKKQGFVFEGNRILLPPSANKSDLREMHAQAVAHNIAKAEKPLRKKENRLLRRMANGTEIEPQRIRPRLVLVDSRSENELLFRYASLHWSIPVSSGYGRRLRFLVIDDYNEKLIGIIGLGDPVFSLGPRDRWVGWDKDTQKARLQNVLDAFVLGAVPPYSYLLAGKLVAMLLLSTEIRDTFHKRYGGRQSLISDKPLDPRLALITTMSALGRSSIYNRIRYQGRLAIEPLGVTRGSGEFHFSNGLYKPIAEYALANCEPTYKQPLWGNGFRSRREVVKKCLSGLGLPSQWLYHGIGREVFAIPLARNSREFLRGKHTRLRWFADSTEQISEFWKRRWMLPRSESNSSYQEWERKSWRIWSEEA